MASDSALPVRRFRRWLIYYPRAVPVIIFLLITAITALSVFAIERGERQRAWQVDRRADIPCGVERMVRRQPEPRNDQRGKHPGDGGGEHAGVRRTEQQDRRYACKRIDEGNAAQLQQESQPAQTAPAVSCKGALLHLTRQVPDAAGFRNRLSGAAIRNGTGRGKLRASRFARGPAGVD